MSGLNGRPEVLSAGWCRNENDVVSLGAAVAERARQGAFPVLAVLATVGGAVLVVLGPALWVQDFDVIREQGSASALTLLAILACGAAAVALWRTGTHGDAWACLAIVTGLAPAALGAPHLAPLPGQAGEVAAALHVAFVVPLGILALRYPRPRVASWARWPIVVVALTAAAIPAVAVAVGGLEGLADATPYVLVGLAVLAVAIVVRVVTAGAPERLALLPLAGVSLGIVGTAAAGAWLADVPSADVLARVVRVAEYALVFLLPVAIGADLVRRASARTTVARAVMDVLEREDLGEFEQVLRRTLRDPRARVWLPNPWGTGWLDSSGAAHVEPQAALHDDAPTPRKRFRQLVHDPTGAPLALVEFADAVRDDPALAAAVLSAAQVGLENQRLALQLRAQIDGLRKSKDRLVRAVDEERQRMIRDLSAGLQARLDTLDDALGRADLAQARRAVNQAHDDLRRLVRGVHPAVLSQSGLGAALESLAETAPVFVRLDVPESLHRTRLRSAVEATAYFVVADAVARAAGAGADHVEVELERAEGRLTVTLTGALTGGEGDAGAHGGGERQDGADVSDRVEALGGAVERVASPRGGGPCLRVTIPSL
jgi:signal transduction histidine kinase